MPSGANAAFLCKQIALSEIFGEHVEDLEHGMLLSNSGYWLVLWDMAAAPTIELVIKDVLKKAGAAGTTLRGCLLLMTAEEEAGTAAHEITEALFVYGLTEPPGHKGYPDQIQVLAKPEFPKARPEFSAEISAAGVTGAELVDKLGQGSQEMLGPLFRLTASGLAVDVTSGSIGSGGTTELFHASNGVCRRLLAIKPGGGDVCLGLAIKAITERTAEQGELLFTCWSSRKGTLRYALAELGFETQLIARFALAD
jgi:hypothetical protein